MQEHKSAVARIRAAIELETTAMYHASLFATTASHKIIQAKYQTLSTLTDQLAEIVPKEQALEMTIASHDAAIEKARQGVDEEKQVL